MGLSAFCNRKVCCILLLGTSVVSTLILSLSTTPSVLPATAGSKAAALLYPSPSSQSQRQGVSSSPPSPATLHQPNVTTAVATDDAPSIANSTFQSHFPQLNLTQSMSGSSPQSGPSLQPKIRVRDHGGNRSGQMLPTAKELGHCMPTLGSYEFPKTKTDFPEQIPKIIWQIWLGDEPIPAVYMNISNMLRKANPTFEYRLLTDRSSFTLLKYYFKGRIGDAFCEMSTAAPKAHAARADLIRYAALYMFGGVYLDFDIMCQDIKKWVKPTDSAVIWKTERLWQQGTLAFAPGHPLLLCVLDLLVTRLYVENDKPNSMPGHLITKPVHTKDQWRAWKKVPDWTKKGFSWLGCTMNHLIQWTTGPVLFVSALRLYHKRFADFEVENVRLGRWGVRSSDQILTNPAEDEGRNGTKDVEPYCVFLTDKSQAHGSMKVKHYSSLEAPRQCVLRTTPSREQRRPRKLADCLATQSEKLAKQRSLKNASRTRAPNKTTIAFQPPTSAMH